MAETQEPAPLREVREILLPSFIRPKNQSKPASHTTGILTGETRLAAFLIDDGTGYGDLRYFVYDLSAIEHREDGTWVVQFQDISLKKLGVREEGYIPNLKEMCDVAEKKTGGYTNFTDEKLYRACKPRFVKSKLMSRVVNLVLKYIGCMHG